MLGGGKTPRYRIVYSMINGEVGMATVTTNCSVFTTVYLWSDPEYFPPSFCFWTWLHAHFYTQEKQLYRYRRKNKIVKSINGTRNSG